MKQLAFSLLFSLLALAHTEARHILGGYMTYRYVGDSVRVKMVIYRDCLGGGAPFDDPANIAVYRNGELFQTLGAALDSVEFINASEQWPCDGKPPFITFCLERGTYEFSLYLPPSDTGSTYQVVYQRCCRANSINNLVDPGGTGHTLTIAVTPDAHRWKNSSPVFPATMPQLVTCVHDTTVFDLSVTDEQGDSLVYSLCNPLTGGGPILSPPGVTTCEGAVPSPPCPPPFSQAIFAAPAYSATNPFSTDVVGLHPTTGRLLFVPHILGTFVYAVCIEEYRAGQLLSWTQHELNLYVVDAGPVAAAEPLTRRNLTLHPNPASAMLRIDLTDFKGKIVEISLADATGRKVFSQKKEAAREEEVGVEQLPPGIYTVQVRSESGLARAKFVISPFRH